MNSRPLPSPEPTTWYCEWAFLNNHLHCLFLDGVYRITDEDPVFQPVRAPTTEQLQTLLNKIIKRTMKLLTRLGYLIEEEGMSYMAETETETDTDTAMSPLQSAACTYRIALGPRAGQKVLTMQSVPSFDAQDTQIRCANQQGFSLHAAVRCAMNQRNKLEQLCRYITRPAIANEWLKLNNAGDVVLQLKSLYWDGTTHIVMSPLEFMQRLAALVPRPRLNLIHFHGVLAPNAKLRAEVTPGGPVTISDTADDLNPVTHSPSARMSWARLLKRVFDIDIEHCPHCGGTMKIVAAILESEVITKILAHLGLPTRAPPRASARSFNLFEMA